MLVGAIAVCVAHPAGAQDFTLDAVSREWTVLNNAVGDFTPSDALSREISVLNNVTGSFTASDAVSREVAILNNATGAFAAVDAVSREYTVWNIRPAGALDLDVPTTLTVLPFRPHPVTNTARLTLGLPQGALVSLRIHDVQGRRVLEPLSAARSAPGWHTLEFDTRGLQSGMYFYRLEVDRTVRKGKLVVGR